jgi:hypothetical protein
MVPILRRTPPIKVVSRHVAIPPVTGSLLEYATRAYRHLRLLAGAIERPGDKGHEDTYRYLNDSRWAHGKALSAA